MVASKFYDTIRSNLFGGSLSQSQVSGLDTIVSQAAARGVPLAHLAYILATAFHETAQTMQPIAEYGKGKGRPYGKPGKYGQAQYGRGYVQLTWDANYERADKELGLSGQLLKNFDLALDPVIAAKIMFTGMQEGWFTGKKLTNYLSGKNKDYVNARRIINGIDKADLIAGYANRFEAALVASGYAATPTQQPSPAPAQSATAKPVPMVNHTPKGSAPVAAGAAAAVAVGGGAALSYWDQIAAWMVAHVCSCGIF